MKYQKRPTTEARRTPSGRSGGWRPISIWRPIAENGTVRFERPPPGVLGDHYATRRVLPRDPRPGERRVVLLGESVAAGYLYAPYLTPAGRLDQLLSSQPELGAVDVIDLARTNETLSGLVTTAQAAQQLEPDLLVVFAGNNWSLLEVQEFSPYGTPSGRQEVAAALESGGLLAVAEAGAQRTLERAALSLEDLARGAGATPVVLIIPEVERDHWEVRQPAPWLPQDAIGSWYQALQRGRRALQANDGLAMLEAAHAMLTVDGGVVSTTYRLLGRAWQTLGRSDRAEDAFCAEIEASPLATAGFLNSPRISRPEQEFLRRSGAELGFEIVDLPDLFARHQKAAQEPVDLWLDYCHLTAEGIDLAMSEVAGRIATRWAGVPIPGAELRAAAEALDVHPAVEARARLGAAVHFAHRALPLLSEPSEPTEPSETSLSAPLRSEIENWCRSAIRVDPASLTTLRTLAELRLASVPPPRAAGASLPSEVSILDPRVLALARGRHRPTPQHGLLWDGLDGHLLRTIDRLLREYEGEGLDFSVLMEPRPGNRVATRWWLESALEQLYPDALDRHGQPRCVHFRAAWPTTTLWTGPTPSDLELRTVLRTPLPGPHPSTIGIAVNGIEQESVTASGGWKERSSRLRARDFGPGLNRLTLFWPMPQGTDSALETVRDQLRQGRVADLHPIFGELHSLSLHRC